MSSDPRILAATAARWAAAGRPQEAVRMLREGIAQQPGEPRLLVALASVLVDAGDPRGAEAASRAVLAIDPQSRQGLAGLSLALLRQGRSDEAAAVIRASIAQDPDDADAWGYYALAGANRRRPAEQAVARDAYRRAIALQPERPAFRQYAAVVEHAFGDRALARAHVRDGLELAPQSPRLLALNAAYAPVAEQPALLVDLLAADPDAAEPREILDAAVTWERRVALAPVAVLPAFVAVCSLAGAAWATDALVLLAAALAALLQRRYAARIAVLPDGYRAVGRARTRRASVVQRVLLAACGACLLAGAAAAWVAPSAAALLLAVAVLPGLGAVAATVPDDSRVLGEVRRRVGRVRGGTAWRFGGLRQELVLWCALGIGVVGLVGIGAAGTLGAVSGTAAAAVALAVVAVVGLHVAEWTEAQANAPQRYLRTLANRYRLLAAGLLCIGLAVTGSGAAAFGAAPFRYPATTGEAPDVLPPAVPLPSYSLPTFSPPVLPSFTVPATLAPSPSPSATSAPTP